MSSSITITREHINEVQTALAKDGKKPFSPSEMALYLTRAPQQRHHYRTAKLMKEPYSPSIVYQRLGVKET